MAMSEVKEPPPKPTRIRTPSTTKSSKQSIVSIGTMINGQQSPITKDSASSSRVNYRTVTQGANSSSAITEVQLGVSVGRGERELDIATRQNNLPTINSGATSKTLATTTTSMATNQMSGNCNIPTVNNNSATTPPRATAPAPPPKPKRISLAPQPKAKPLNLQSAPIQIKDVTQPVTSSVPIPVAQSLQPSILPTTPTKTSNGMQQNGYSSSKSITSSISSPSPSPSHSIPPPKKPRSAEHSMDGSLSHMESTSGYQRFKNQSITRSSSPPPLMSKSNPNIGTRAHTDFSTLDKRIDPSAGTNPALVGARSRLRSTSDAKASTSLAVAVSQTTKTQATKTNAFNDNDGIGFVEYNKGHVSPLVSPTHAPSHVGRYGFYDEDAEDTPSAASGERLTASLHKIQARAQEQTERMKQVNYAEKRADLAEVMYEKSNLWRARGAEWSGIAKKAWEDRGGVGGITGGFADRWKKRGESGNDNMLDYPRPGPAAQIFGLPLVDAVRISKISAKTGVPAIVTRCIEYLDIMGVEEVGLYRVSGSTTNVARLKATFDNGNDHDLLQKGNEPQNPHDVAALLKLYLRECKSEFMVLNQISAPFYTVANYPSGSYIKF
ncbi:hypothetical protein BGZ76_002789 [Entomortierella beljakovae]|nr:hypothetical protein BGZ76_002789 [Entomortierella beljakovae]